MRSTIVVVVALLGGLATQGMAQVRTLAGRVSDSVTGEPLSAGTVTVRETGASDELRPDGVFVVRAPLQRVTLQVRASGYRTISVTVPIQDDVVMVSLTPDAITIEALVVEGRGEGSGVTGEDLNRVPAANIKQALYGRVAGVDVQSNSGAPGDNLQVRLRGVTSILGSTAPLYVIDGIIVSDASIPSGVSAVTGGQDDLPGRLADLSLHDIERIDVLKGAAATLQYGSRGSNGVILITTKRGRP